MPYLYRTKYWATAYNGPFRSWRLQQIEEKNGFVTETWLGTLFDVTSEDVAAPATKAMKAMKGMGAMKAKGAAPAMKPIKAMKAKA